ncbi:pantoate--beta-alanine ligase [Virgibacillus kekensis]|uniref:Pantothenate synthetase n=1 Tax=Virgibacillus kekensis TaxID=202261 RepID=A0ABV9DF27_9BACI
MEIIRSVKEMQNKMKELASQETIGFVPTMGYFHEGHLALMTEAVSENSIAITSIFVNPLQFGPNEDFDKYPRDEKRDLRLAEETGIDIVFAPEQKDMYPVEMTVAMSMTNRVDTLCGRSRPGHFDGVGTVLTKLFNIISPDRVYFGLKDAQQVAIVDALIEDLNFPVELIALPTVREPDGLAKSSRNVNLKTKERKEAVWLSRALETGRQMAVDGQQNPAIIVKEVTDLIKNHTSGTTDYVELLSYPNLEPVHSIDQQVILAVAVKFSGARLIDNLIFDADGNLIRRLR